MNESYRRTHEEIAGRLRERDAEQAVARIASADKAAGLPVFGERAMREFERSSSPMRIFDLATLKFLAVNDAAVSFYGYNREEFLGMSVTDLRHPDEHGALRNSLAEQSDYLRHRPPRRHVTKSGEIMTVELVTQDILYNGRRARLSLTMDLTGRLRMQELLWQRQEEFERLVEHSPDIVSRIDRSYRHLYVNSAVTAATGRSPQEFIGRTVAEVGMSPELTARWLAVLKEAFATAREQSLECAFTGPGGERHYESRIIPERGADGGIETVLVVTRDFTERKKAENEAQRQKNLLAAIIDNLPVGVFIRDAETLRYVARNRFLEKSNGYKVDTSIGKSAYDLFPRDQADICVTTDRKALESGEMVEVPEQEMLGRSGEPRLFHVRKVPLRGEDGTPQLLVGIADDITDRKRAENALRESNEFLHSVIESSRDCIKVLDLDGRLQSINAGGQRLMEIDDAIALVGKLYLDFWSGEDRVTAEKVLRIARGGDMGRFEGFCPTVRGHPKWWDEIVTPILDKHGRPQKLLVVSRDITDYKRAENALRESEERFRQLAENIRQVFWIATLPLDKLIYISPAYEEIWGRSRDSLYRNPRSWMDSAHPDDLPRVRAAAESMARGRPLDVEYRIIRPDGTLRWIRDRSYPMKAADGTQVACGIAEDITDLKAAEQEKLTHAIHQRDALVREVHHRIKNSLQGVVWLLRQKIRKHPAVAPDIEEAIGQLQSLALVYGLQETRPDGLLSLAEITDAICSSAEKLVGGRVNRAFGRETRRQACIAGVEAVSVAVALNELVFNALKHQPAPAGRKRATVRLSEAPGAAEIRITNRGRLPRSFDFERGRAVGYGLGLVRTLLAPPGGAITFNGGRGRVEVKLTLAPPLLAGQRKAYAK